MITMGGIKHNRWYSNPAEPKVSRPDASSEDANAWSEWAQQSVQVSCRICGQGIVLASGGSVGMQAEGGLDPQGAAAEQWKEEVEAGMHKECFIKYMQIQRMRQNGNQSR